MCSTSYYVAMTLHNHVISRAHLLVLWAWVYRVTSQCVSAMITSIRMISYPLLYYNVSCILKATLRLLSLKHLLHCRYSYFLLSVRKKTTTKKTMQHSASNPLTVEIWFMYQGLSYLIALFTMFSCCDCINCKSCSECSWGNITLDVFYGYS